MEFFMDWSPFLFVGIFLFGIFKIVKGAMYLDTTIEGDKEEAGKEFKLGLNIVFWMIFVSLIIFILGDH